MSERPTVLLVDDEPGILDVLARFARRAGFEVVTCSGGRQAIEYLSVHTVHVALIDLRMPDVGGLDVLRALREEDPHCQAVLMTGYASSGYGRRGHQARGDGLPEQAA
jgi:DNA-binding NtrC family response regulator